MLTDVTSKKIVGHTLGHVAEGMCLICDTDFVENEFKYSLHKNEGN